MTLTELLEAVKAAPPEELPKLAGQVEEVRATIAQRLNEPPATRFDVGTELDRNVDINEAMRLTGMSRSWLEHNAPRLKFAVKVGRRRLFSLRGIEKWNRQNLARAGAERS